MSKANLRVYSNYSQHAMAMLGQLILLHRKERKMTAQDLADRAGISRMTLHKVERGDMKCEIGIVFELAALVGVKLLESEESSLRDLQTRIEDKISLLPHSIRSIKRPVDDKF